MAAKQCLVEMEIQRELKYKTRVAYKLGEGDKLSNLKFLH